MAPCSETCNETMAAAAVNVCIGQIAVADSSGLLRSVLGSCVGVALYHPHKRVGVLAHVVLPASEGRGGHPGRYANTAIPEALRLLDEHGADPGDVTAKIVGGASMFGNNRPVQIGQANIDAVTEALRRANISIAAQHTGESKGRRITLDCETGDLTVEVVGELPIKM